MYFNIRNKIYTLEYNVGEVVYVKIFSISNKYRGLKYSYRIFNSLTKYKLPIVLECWPTLIPFYQKLGFKEVGMMHDGYIEMEYF
jgi:hypothetical protein